MVELEGETYLIAIRAAEYIGVSRNLFYANVKPFVPAHKIGARRRKHYKRSDLERFRVVEMVA